MHTHTAICPTRARRARRMLCAAACAAAALALPASRVASQVPTGAAAVDVGDVYYLHRLTGPDEQVLVVLVDRVRGWVKIQHGDGTIDWVRPDVLLTRAGARQASVNDAVVGTTIVAGIVWAILDPQGFQRAMESGATRQAPAPRQAYSPSAPPAVASTNAVAIEATPFAPLAVSEWAERDAEWVAWGQTFLNASLPAAATSRDHPGQDQAARLLRQHGAPGAPRRARGGGESGRVLRTDHPRIA